MLEDIELEDFSPELGKLIAAFAIAVQQSGISEGAAPQIVQTALDIYNQGYVSLQNLRHVA